MKCKPIWLFVALATFIIGVVSAMVWFKVSTNNQQPVAESKSVQTSERIRVCSKRYNINLGDSFQEVDKVINLNLDPNGPNENVSWQAGKLTDFYSVREPSIKLDEENQLNPYISCTFDDRQKLKTFRISWTHDGQKSDAMKRTIFDALIEKEFNCVTCGSISLKKDTLTDTIDFGKYVQKFEYDFSESASVWWVSYSITLK